MMEREQLRKADIFSGAAIVGVGVFIISQAVQMPMKDSWGGVQNVWYVSPALFPLFVGAMLTLLGLLLMKTALKAVGLSGLQEVFSWLAGPHLGQFLKRTQTVRYYGVVVNLFVFVFLLIPRVDFFIAAVFFLIVLFFMYYCGDHQFLIWLLLRVSIGALLLALAVFSGLLDLATNYLSYPLDWLLMGCIATVLYVCRKEHRLNVPVARKFQKSIVIAFVAPFLVGVIFKYFLLVPMPKEGLIVQVLDSIWYSGLW